MNARLTSLAAVALALAPLGGAAAAAPAPPDGGTISIEPRTADGEYDPSTRAFADAAAEALGARGFTILDGTGHAAYVAELILSRGEVGTGLARVPGQRTASVVGVGVSIPLATGKSDLVAIRRTRLELRIRRRGDSGVLWDGTAVTVREAGTRQGADAAVATDLSQAVLQSYPAEPKDVVGVP